MNDAYFQKLHSLRNDAAKASRTSSIVLSRTPSSIANGSPNVPKKLLGPGAVVGLDADIKEEQEQKQDHSTRVLEKRIPLPTF
jgi:hypothetical protein